MSVPSENAASISFIRTAAQLFVADIETSCHYYANRLGFELVFAYGEPAFYAQVQRGGGVLNLRHVDTSVIDAERRDREELLAADIAIGTEDELVQLFAEFLSAGASFYRTLTKEPWGATTFIVKDPDGNLVLFAARSSG
jgi:catechol 2,3-dioxygenase-like lactoylglutathione lyase family enzyme